MEFISMLFTSTKFISKISTSGHESENNDCLSSDSSFKHHELTMERLAVFVEESGGWYFGIAIERPTV
ncbi:hypothetical protein PVK06_031564 [Gossypium arboreum]|uniref:Uncharacterized protein n=1 Tax=Gossypium arboreum TaxID=29729 RepID=A0ABR0NRF3_GOSAR|nr:hypothetical protein PVK06_031564 [Gossypium arboreum]